MPGSNRRSYSEMKTFSDRPLQYQCLAESPSMGFEWLMVFCHQRHTQDTAVPTSTVRSRTDEPSRPSAQLGKARFPLRLRVYFGVVKGVR